jgi:hypothetical protein
MTANETLNGTHNGVQNGISNIAQDTATENPQPTTSVQLQGKVIAITGANRGIGLGIANSCLNNGAAHVYSIDIGDTGDDFLAVAKRFPGQLHALKADVTNEDTVTAAVDRIIEEVGAIHGFVANAGRTKHKPALDFTKEEIDQLWSINLYGSFFCARVAARAFIKLGVKGSIVFTASMASYQQACAVSALRCEQSRCSQHDTHSRHGVGAVQYQSQQRVTWSGQHSHDLLGAPTTRLGAAAEVLRRHATLGRSGGVGRCLRLLAERCR